jgi:hypothetical protein
MQSCLLWKYRRTLLEFVPAALKNTMAERTVLVNRQPLLLLKTRDLGGRAAHSLVS